MSIIEQAAKRLEQLRQAGVEVGEQRPPAEAEAAVEARADAVPLRVIKELEARAVAAEPTT